MAPSLDNHWKARGRVQNATSGSESGGVAGSKRWLSCAEWDERHGFQNNITIDKHHTKGEAEAVCRLLEREGLGGERCHFPLKTWVEQEA